MAISKRDEKKALALSVELIENGPDHYTVNCADPKFTIDATTTKEALANATVLKPFLSEYRWFEFVQAGDGSFTISCEAAEFQVEEENLEDAIAQALDAVPERPASDVEGAAEDAAEAEEDEREGSIVPRKYRDEYKARGDATRCGDWLCTELDPWTTTMQPSKTGKGKSVPKGDPEKTYAVAKANGVDKEWRGLNSGQQCMNARNMIRSHVLKVGKLVIPASITGGEDKTIEAPQSWKDEIARKRTEASTRIKEQNAARKAAKPADPEAATA